MMTLVGTLLSSATALVLPGVSARHLPCVLSPPPSVRAFAPSMQEAGLDLKAENAVLRARVSDLEEQLGRTEGLCEVLDSGADFNDSLKSRASWLLGLLICQSGSSFILEGNEALIQSHPVIVYFMTMLVGAGGNAGNQASVRIIRGLATGEVNPVSEGAFIASEVRMAICLSLIVVAAGFVRYAAGLESSLSDSALAASPDEELAPRASVLWPSMRHQRMRSPSRWHSSSSSVRRRVVLLACHVAPPASHANSLARPCARAPLRCNEVC